MRAANKQINKKPEDYNTTDLVGYWNNLWLKTYNQRYNSFSRGHELHLFKDLLAIYNVYEILLSIHNFLKSGKGTIKHFSEVISDYLPDTRFTFLEYHTKYNNIKVDHQKLLELSMLEAKWFPTPENEKRLQILAKELEEQCLKNRLE